MIRGKCKLVGILLELKLDVLWIWEQMDMVPRKRIEALTCPAPPAWTAVGEFQPQFLPLLRGSEEPVLWKTQDQGEFTEIVCLQCTVLVRVSTTLCDPVDCSLPGSSISGILQARILEWVAMPAFRGSS